MVTTARGENWRKQCCSKEMFGVSMSGAPKEEGTVVTVIAS